MRKWSSLAAIVPALLCASPALAAEDSEALVAAVCPIINSSAFAQHLPVAFLSGLIWQESNFRPAALSPVGARGIAQFMPGTAAERGLTNPDDPEAAIPKAAEFLSSLRQRFGNLGLAAAAYNAGPTRVASWLAGAGDLPPETRGYVMTVTRHPVEDWNGPNAAKLTDDLVFPNSSCVQHIAAVSHANPAAFAGSALYAAKGSAMWNEYVNALNAYLSSPPIQKFYTTYLASLRLEVLICVALIFFVLVYIRGPLKNIRDELRRNKTQLEALLRAGVTDANPILSRPVQVADRKELLRAEPAERLYQRDEPRGWLRLVGFSPEDQATAQKLFRGLGRGGATAPEAQESPPAPPEPAVSNAGPLAASDPAAQEKSATSLPEALPLLAPASRKTAPELEKAKARGLRLSPPIGIGLAALAACGALVIYGEFQNSTFASVKTQAVAGFDAAIGALQTPLEAITGAKEREQERAELHDLGAALAQATARLDEIENEYGARLDKLSARIDDASSSRFADIAARLDRLEQKTAAPTAPASQLADVTTELDKLEKSVQVAAASASQYADFATRLDKLEKKAALPAAPPPEVADGAARLDKAEKRPGVAAANSATPLPPAAPKPSTLLARAEPPVPTERARPDGAKPLLRDYSVEDVRFGIALVGTRHGSQQVAPGDMIPGAGRVLRIERQGGDWLVVTTLGVISSGPGAF